MDQEEFKRRLSEVAIVKEVQVAGEANHTRKHTTLEPATELVMVGVLNPTPICPGCNSMDNNKLDHMYILKHKYRLESNKILKSTCPNCKNQIDIRTNTVIDKEKKPVGVYYVAQGLRKAAPGKKLGRPTKQQQFIAECNALAEQIKQSKDETC